MSAFIFMQEANADLATFIKIGLTSLSIFSVLTFGVVRWVKSMVSKKVNKDVFAEYKEGHAQVHEEYRDDIKEIKDGINDLRKEKKDKTP